MKNTKIQWCDSTVNPVMGCDGCPLYPSPASVRKSATEWLQTQGVEARIGRPLINDLLQGKTLSEIYHLRHDSSGRIAASLEAAKFPLPRGFEKALARQFSMPVSCYAAILHLIRGRNPLNPDKWINPGYAEMFEQPKKFNGRTAMAARWADLKGIVRPDSPWKNGLPRLIFVSDMGDSLSGAIDFEFLKKEVVDVAASLDGRRHIWLWLSKRPARMAKFDRWLEAGGIQWPDNLVPMTSVIDMKMAAGVHHLKSIRARVKGLSIEPLLEAVKLDLKGIDWVIVGGESGSGARPFHLEWACDVMRQSRRAGTAFFMKQLGSAPFQRGKGLILENSHGGDWDEWPDDLRVREFPEHFTKLGHEVGSVTQQHDCSASYKASLPLDGRRG
jgi:protein gp37